MSLDGAGHRCGWCSMHSHIRSHAYAYSNIAQTGVCEHRTNLTHKKPHAPRYLCGFAMFVFQSEPYAENLRVGKTSPDTHDTARFSTN